MHPELQEACSSLGLKLTNLERAAHNAHVKQVEARSRLVNDFGTDDCFDVVAFGSLAREELSEQSDFDFAVVAFGLSDHVDRGRSLLKALDGLRARWEQNPPG
ncbi:MAG: nucleotidyltransferase domain-containing protein, partial [Candidatus Eremiobacterota bacterium]